MSNAPPSAVVRDLDEVLDIGVGQEAVHVSARSRDDDAAGLVVNRCGSRCQLLSSVARPLKVSLHVLALAFLARGIPHHIQWRRPPGPELERRGRLADEHLTPVDHRRPASARPRDQIGLRSVYTTSNTICSADTLSANHAGTLLAPSMPSEVALTSRRCPATSAADACAAASHRQVTPGTAAATSAARRSAAAAVRLTTVRSQCPAAPAPARRRAPRRRRRTRGPGARERLAPTASSERRPHASDVGVVAAQAAAVDDDRC